LTKTQKRNSFIYDCKQLKIQDASDIAALRAVAQHIGWHFVSDNKLVETFNKMKADTNNKKTDEFLRKCSKLDVSNIENEEVKNQIYTIAKSLEMIGTKDEFVNYYIVTNKNKILTKEATIKNKEITAEKFNIKYKNLYGVQKLKDATRDEITAQNNLMRENDYKIDQIRRGYNAAYQSSKQHVPDWAIHGGIASGIAGSAAGAMVAMDVKQRADTAKKANATIGAFMLLAETEKLEPYYKKRDKIKRKLEKLNKIMSIADYLTVRSIEQDELLGYLSPICKEISVSEIGTTVISVSTQKYTLVIDEDIKSVIDGTIEVQLMNGETKIGSKYFSLPYSGSKYNYSTKIYCHNITEKITDVTFKVHKLWTIEDPTTRK